MSTPDFFRSQLDAMIDLQHPMVGSALSVQSGRSVTKSSA